MPNAQVARVVTKSMTESKVVIEVEETKTGQQHFGYCHG